MRSEFRVHAARIEYALLIIVFLGVLIGGLVVAMYLPIFKLGSVV